MISILLALGGIVSLGALGGLIDFMMRGSEKKKLEAWLIAWWVRFDDVKRGNFGREEARWFVDLLDRWFGASLWSAKRWTVVLPLSLVLLAVTIVWISLRYVAAHAGAPNLAQALWTFWTNTLPRPDMAILIALVALSVLFGASFSFMRLIAWLVARWSPDGWTGFVVFLLLVAVQVAVLLYWSVVYVTALVLLIAPLVYANLSLALIWKDLQFAVFDKLSPAERWSEIWDPFSVPIDATSGIGHLLNLYTSELTLIANGLRLGFALVFLASFLFQPVIKPFVSRLWEGVIESRKPVFTLLLGSIGVVAGVVSQVLHLIK